jgi:molybdopterin synthase catalytic subunit
LSAGVKGLKNSVGVHKKGTFTLDDVMRSVRESPDFYKSGAVAMFIGVVRGETEKHENVEKLHLEAYEEKADQVLAGICQDLKTRPGIVDVQIHHMLGEFEVGEDLVYVSVAGSHREQLFPVLEEAVQRYKKEAPIFKKEQIKLAKGRKRAYWKTEQQTGARGNPRKTNDGS